MSDLSMPPAPAPEAAPTKPEGDVGITALYTSRTWVWARLPGAQLFRHWVTALVFHVVNLFVGVTRLFRPGLPSLRHSLVQRHLMIDWLIRRLGGKQVIEVACGLSPRGARVTDDPSMRYVEVDLPAMVATKRKLLERTAAGRGVLERPGFRLVAGDAREVDLASLIDGTQPVWVIAEGLLMYLSAEEQLAFFARMANLVARVPGSGLVFDLVPDAEQPRLGWLERAMDGFVKRFTKGKFVERDRRTRAEVVDDLRRAGFATVDIHEPATFDADCGLPYLQTPTLVVLFVARAT